MAEFYSFDGISDKIYIKLLSQFEGNWFKVLRENDFGFRFGFLDACS